jgi:hypothetical protein
MIRLLIKHHQQHLPFEGLVSRPLITSQLNRPTKDVQASIKKYSTSSSKHQEGRGGRTILDEPIGIAEALRARYVSPLKTIYGRLGPKKSAANGTTARRKDADEEEGKTEGGGRSEEASQQQQQQPLPESITEAWRIGLQGTHPARFSQLRARAATPVVVPARLPTSDLPPSADLLSSDSSSVKEPPDAESPGAEAAKKKSLLQSYLGQQPLFFLLLLQEVLLTICLFLNLIDVCMYVCMYSPR